MQEHVTLLHKSFNSSPVGIRLIQYQAQTLQLWSILRTIQYPNSYKPFDRIVRGSLHRFLRHMEGHFLGRRGIGGIVKCSFHVPVPVGMGACSIFAWLLGWFREFSNILATYGAMHVAPKPVVNTGEMERMMALQLSPIFLERLGVVILANRTDRFDRHFAVRLQFGGRRYLFGRGCHLHILAEACPHS